MSFHYWNLYFEQHHQMQFPSVNWNEDDELSVEEKQLITPSIQQFQKGENSDGKNLFSKSSQLQNSHYTGAIRNFIKEEQNHAKALGSFMDLHSIDRIQKDPLDFIFKSILKLSGIGGIVVTMTTAEIIAMIYYDTLRKAVRSGMLNSICEDILKDEVEHLKFQSYTLAHIYKGHFLRSIILGLYHSVLIRGTILVVWLFHRRMWRAGGIRRFGEFYERAMKEYYVVKLQTYQHLSADKIIATPA